MSLTSGQGVISTGTSYFWTFAGFQGLSGNQYRDYRLAWDYFELVQNSNAAISTANGTSNIPRFSYITFASEENRVRFKLGQLLHQQQYSNTNFNFQAFNNR